VLIFNCANLLDSHVSQAEHNEVGEQKIEKVVFSWPEKISLDLLKASLPKCEVEYCALENPNIIDALERADIWIPGGPPIQPWMLAKANRLRWIQTLGVGLPGFFFEKEFRARGIKVSNARGVNITNLAEHALAMMLSFARGIPELTRRQSRSEWLYQTFAPPLFELEGQTLGILGYGAIGRAVARRAKAFGMTVWAMRRTPQSTDELEVDRILPPEALGEILRQSDQVLLALPATPETTHLIDRSALATMKPSAYIYNIARGSILDQDALIDALRAKSISGAGLDVTTPEPLPASSPLWGMPNVLITAHLAGTTPRFFDRVLVFIAENVRLYLSGKPVRNLVDLETGY